MNKVVVYDRNTIDSIEWHHKGYVVYRNPCPSGIPIGGTSNRAWMSNYLVARPGNDTADFECPSLAEAKASIERDLSELAGYEG